LLKGATVHQAGNESKKDIGGKLRGYKKKKGGNPN